MKSNFFTLISIFLVGCSSEITFKAMEKKDLEGFAIASCLTFQESPYLKDQGDAWASVIVQRMSGDFGTLPKIAEVVKKEVSKGIMAVIRAEGVAGKDKILPILYCNEIVYTPAVQAVIADSLKVAP